MAERKVQFSKGPAEVMRALTSGDPVLIAEALEFQREAFRAQFGCYPEEMTETDGRVETGEDAAASGRALLHPEEEDI